MSKKFLIILIALLLIFPPSLLGAPGMARSAGAIWDLDESSGTRYDSVTQGVGPAAQFTAANSEYLSIADNASLSTGDIDFSFAVWVYLDSNASIQVAVGKGTTGADVEYDLQYNNTANRFKLTVYSNVGAEIGVATANNLGAPSLATWYFIVAWHDSVANTVSIQVNNGTADTAATTGVSSDTTATFRIGAVNSTPTAFWNGRMALAGFWKRVLTDAERAELYNSGKGYAYRDLSGSLKTSLISYWNLNESAGVRFDSQGSNDLQDNNTVTQATGVRGDNTLGRAATPYAAQFTAANSEYLSIADNASLSTGDIDFTVCAWSYLDTLGAVRQIVSKGDATFTRNQAYGLYTTVGNVAEFSLGNGTASNQATASSFGALSANTWYFICGWHDSVANTNNIQVNTTVNSTGWTGGSYDDTLPFDIGAQPAGNPNSSNGTLWNGRIALVGFWKKVLSATERAHLYNSGKGLSYSELSRTLSSLTTSLNAYWNLSEASGTRADSAGSNTLADNATVTQNAGVPRGTAGTVPAAAGRGKSSIAGQFTAANSEYISIPDNAALSLGTDTSFTIAAWVYLDSKIAVRALVSKGNTTAAGAMAYHLIYNDGTDRFRLQVGNGAGSQTVLDANTFGSPSTATWYFVSGWHDAGSDTINISVNNGVANSAAHTIGTFDDTFELDIGKSGNQTAGFMDGRISKVGVWKKVLSATEVTDLYNSGRGNFYDGAAFYKDTGGTLKTSLQAWWELDELCCTRFDKVSPGVGPAADFERDNAEYLSRTDNADLSAGDIDFMLALWIKAETIISCGAGVNNCNEFLNKGRSGPTGEFNLRFDWNNGDRVYFTVSDGTNTTQVSSNATVAAGNWYFVVAWHDATANTINVSVDNGSTASQSHTTGVQDSTGAFTLGAEPIVDRRYDGAIQLVGFWKRVLTADERTSLYNSGSGRHCKDLNDQLRRKLISYWNLNEGSGTRYDCVGANDLTDNATVTQATGVAGGNSLGDNATVTHQQGLPWWTKARASGQFTAANSEYLSITDNSDVSVDGTNFTISAWVYLDSKPTGGIITKWDEGAAGTKEFFLRYEATGDRFNFQVRTTGGTEPTVSANNLGVPALATWYFIIAWYDGTNLNISVNNGTADQTANSTPVQATTQALNIGRYVGAASANRLFDGRIDEVGFWKKALTAQERADLYNSGKANRYNGNSFEKDTDGTLTTSLTAYWTLDEASGTRYDSKGANHLTDNNTVTQNVGIDGTAAAQFTRANSEYLSIPDNAALSTGNIDFTVGAWVYVDSNPGAPMRILMKGNDAPREYSFLSDTGNTLIFGIGDGASATQSLAATNVNPLNIGVWYLLIGWVDVANNTLNVQVNNGPVDSVPKTVTVSDLTAPLELGHTPTHASEYFNGRIDQVMFFKRVLTESERAALYNEGIGQNYQTLQRESRKRTFY